MGYANVGKVWTPDSLPRYLRTLEKPSWCHSVTLHHTAEPSLAMRPKGFLLQHIENLKAFYQEKGWHDGPHIFVDEDELLGMCDFRSQGVHAVSFNRSSIGIEVLGDYDIEDPFSGRGLNCWITAAAGARAILSWLGLDATTDTVHFHRDDPQTSKTCPGKKITKSWVLDLINKPEPVNAINVSQVPPDIGMPWAFWDYRGGKWCLPLYDFLISKGVSQSEISQNFKSIGGEFFYGRELLEGAYYVGKNSPNVPNERTWIPAREAIEVLATMRQG